MADGYSDIVHDHFQHPRHVGVLAHPDAVGQAENPVSGASIVLYLAVVDGVIQQALFQAQGCAATIAAGSMVTDLLVGHSLSFARGLTRAVVENALGGLPPTRKHAADLAVAVVQDALAHLIQRQ